jgi:predicted Zn-ribbon and HTH transcriptional regulator
MTEDKPHSRACGYVKHNHGTACHKNCPTCHGQPISQTEDHIIRGEN